MMIPFLGEHEVRPYTLINQACRVGECIDQHGLCAGGIGAYRWDRGADVGDQGRC